MDAKADDAFRNLQVYVHALGQDPESEQPIFGPNTPNVECRDIDFPFVTLVPGSSWALASVNRGVENENTIYLAPVGEIAPRKTKWRKLVGLDDAVTWFDAHGDDLYLMTHKGAPRFRVVRVNMRAANLDKADVIVPASERVVTGIGVASDGLYVRPRDGGPSRLLRVPYGKVAGEPVEVKLPFEGAIASWSTLEDQPGVVFKLGSWTHSEAVFRFDSKASAATDTGIVAASSSDFSNIESDSAAR